MRIIIDHASPFGGDCTQYFKCHLDSPSTLKEFVSHVLSNKREWGDIEVNRHKVIEYRHGEIVSVSADYDKIKDKTVSLTGMSGGWTRMDYELKLE